MTAASAPSRAQAQADAAPGSSYHSTHAVMALLGSHLAASIPHDASGEEAWTAASQALVQFIQESSRAEQRPKPLLERLQSILAQHGATAAVDAAAQQASTEPGDPSDPQNLQWLCCASTKQQQLMQQILGMIWDPRSEEKADKCLNAVASAVIKHWCTPQMLDKLKEDLASTDTGQPVAPSSLFRPGAARDKATPDVPMWSMDMAQAVDVARYQGLLEDQRVTTPKQIQTIFEQDDRLRCFKLSGPKAGLGIKLHWISILHSYRKVVKQNAERERERLARKERERIAQMEREQKAQSDREQKAQADREQKAQAQPGAAAASRQADLAGRSPLSLGSIKHIIIQACKEKAFRLGSGSDQISFQQDSLIRQAACSLLLEGFCTRHGVAGTKATVRAADLAEYHQAAGQLGAGVLSNLSKHPAFKNIPNPCKGYLQVLIGDSEKQKHLPGDSICSTAARPFVLTMMQGCDWRVQFNVDFIWEAAADIPAAPNAAAREAAAESDTSLGSADNGTHAPAANGAKQGKVTVMKQILGSSSSGALGVLPMWVLLKKVGTLLPLTTKPGASTVTKQTLLFHLAARAVLSCLASSLLPDPGGATPADVKNVLVSRSQISTFKVAATRACEYIQSMLATGSYCKYAEVAGEGPTRGLVALLQSATCAQKKTPMFRLSLHADRCTWSVGLMADWIWVGAEDVEALQPELSAGTSSSGGGAASAAAAKAVLPKGAPVPVARFAGIELDPVLEVQLSELPPASYKGLLHAAAMACTALDIVSKFKGHSKSHSKEDQAASASAADSKQPKPGGSDSSTGKVVLEDRILMQTAVEVLLEGYYRTFKTETIPAVKLAKYAPSFHTMSERVCTKAKLRLTEHSSQLLQDKAPFVQALRSCIQAQASGRELPLIVLTTAGGTLRASLTVQRLWACLPQPGVMSKGKASAAAQGSLAPVRPAAQPAAMPQPAMQVPQQPPKAAQQPLKVQQQPLGMPQPAAGGVAVQPAAGANGSTVSNGHHQPLGVPGSASVHASSPGSSHPTAAFSSAPGHLPRQAPGIAAAWQAPGVDGTGAPTFPTAYAPPAPFPTAYAPPAPFPTAYTPPAAAAAADFSTMLQAGLPAEWHSPSGLMEFWQVLLGAVDLVWPPPRPDSASSQDASAFVCNVVAKQAVDAGIQHHLHRLAQQAVLRTEPQAFAVRLQAAGQAAIDAWQAAGGGAGHSGGGSGAELLRRGPLYAGVLIAAWQQEQPAGQAPLLCVLNMAETDPGATAAVATVVRLDAAGLLDLASSIQFADELALDLLLL